MTGRVRNYAAIAIVAILGATAACSDSDSRDVPVGPSPSDPGTGGALTAPTIESPSNDLQLVTLRPAFTVRNATGGTGARVYEFQISETADFSSTTGAYLSGFSVNVTRTGITEGTGSTTTFTPDGDLQPATRLYWRARAVQGSTTTAWTAPATFRTALVGINRPGELYDPLGTQAMGAISGPATFVAPTGLRLETNSSWVRYELAQTLIAGVISVEVEGLTPNRPQEKPRIFSMMDGGSSLFDSKFLFNVQYRGAPGNPDNAISYKVLMGDSDLKYEPDLAQRSAGVRALNPATTYFWTAEWGTSFRLVVREGSITGAVIYERSQGTPGFYNPLPHTAFLGANDAAKETGSWAGAVYRNFWVGTQQRPASLGSALR